MVDPRVPDDSPLWRKTIGEACWMWCGCAAALFAFCWLRLWLTSQIDMSRFQQIFESIPESLTQLVPVPVEQLMSYTARIAMMYEEPVTYLAMSLWTISRSSDVVSGELGRGTMEMQLAQPVSRLKVLFIPTTVTVCGVALLALVSWVGIATGINVFTAIEPPTEVSLPLFGFEIPLFSGGSSQRVPMHELVDPHVFLPAAVNYFAFGFFLTGVGTLVSATDRYRYRTIGILMAFYVVEVMIELVMQTVDEMSLLAWATFLSCYEPVAVVCRVLEAPDSGWSLLLRDASGSVVGLGPLGMSSVLVGLGSLAFAAAGVIFCRRDIPAPL